MAVPGVYPFLFTKAGYKGQLAWLQDTAACGGVKAFSILLSAAREGEVQLPLNVEIRHKSGQSVHLGPALTTPSTRDLKRSPALSLEVVAGRLVTKHGEVERQEGKEAAWELQVPEPPEVEEGQKEKQEDQKPKKKEEDGEEVEEKACNPVEEGPTKDSLEEMRKQEEQEAVRRKKIFVHCDNPSSVTLEQLKLHFQQYDTVENIFMFLDHAVVTMKSAVVAQSLAGRTATLQRAPELGGCVPLRLRGGSGRVRGVPPRHQRNIVCPFR